MALKKRTTLALIAMSVITTAVVAYLVLVLQELRQSIDVPILAYVTDDSYPFIPKPLARSYFEYSHFDPNANTRLEMPAYNFLLAGYGTFGEANNRRILELSDLFIQKCADIDRVYQGYSPLNAAVLSNEPELVQHLVLHGANLHQKVDRPGSKFNGMVATEFAVALAAHEPRDITKVLAALSAQPNPSFRQRSAKSCAFCCQ